MSEDKDKESKAPAGINRLRRRARRRGWLETAAAAFVLVAIIGGGYYGFYVNNRTDRLGDYYSRSLASGAEIAQQALDRIWLNVCNARNGGGRLALIAGLTVLNADVKGRDDQPDWCEGSQDLEV
ncbi:MAG: hypothetical protein AAGA95_12295, partial [Pseudomonadota bacterium]